MALRWVDLHTACQNHKHLYRGLNWVQSCVPSRWSQQHLGLSRLHSCKWLPAGRTCILRPREGVRSLWWPRFSSWVSWWSCPLDDLLQQMAGVYPGCCVPNEGRWLPYWPYLLGVTSASLPDIQVHGPYYFTSIHGTKPKWGSATLDAWIFVSSMKLEALTLSNPASSTSQD